MARATRWPFGTCRTSCGGSTIQRHHHTTPSLLAGRDGRSARCRDDHRPHLGGHQRRSGCLRRGDEPRQCGWNRGSWHRPSLQTHATEEDATKRESGIGRSTDRRVRGASAAGRRLPVWGVAGGSRSARERCSWLRSKAPSYSLALNAISSRSTRSSASSRHALQTHIGHRTTRSGEGGELPRDSELILARTRS